MRREATYLLQRRNSVRVMAARHHRVPHGETEHLGGRIILVSLFGRTTCNKTRLLVIIGLSRLHIAYLRVVEIAEHLGKKSGFRHVIRIECCDDFVPFKADLM